MKKEDHIIKKLIGRYKTTDPFLICEKMNIDVRYANLGELRGMFRYSRRNTFITINSALDLAPEEGSFVCAHELGHLLLHKQYNRLLMLDMPVYRPTRYEKEANRFAMKLVLHELPQPEKFNFFEQLTENLGIPIEYEELSV